MATHADMEVCVRREIAMRRAVYPGRVRAHRMKLETADREIDTMVAVLAFLEAHRPKEEYLPW